MISTLLMCCIGLCIVAVTAYASQKTKFEINELTDMVYRLESQITKMKREIAKLNRKIIVADNDDKEKK